MKYRVFMKKIMQQLTEYKETVDKLATSYLAEKTAHEKKIQGMEGKYTPEYIEESRKSWKPSTNYSGIINTAREHYQKTANAYIDQIQKEMDGYFLLIRLLLRQLQHLKQLAQK